MDVHPYYGPGAVVLDSCARCTLIWLDHGEIAAIERAPGRT
jgi:Zn-finger nucleic acid-binding protein